MVLHARFAVSSPVEGFHSSAVSLLSRVTIFSDTVQRAVPYMNIIVSTIFGSWAYKNMPLGCMSQVGVKDLFPCSKPIPIGFFPVNSNRFPIIVVAPDARIRGRLLCPVEACPAPLSSSWQRAWLPSCKFCPPPVRTSWMGWCPPVGS